MLAKKNRLTKKLFDITFKKSKRFHTDFFTVLYSPSEVFNASVVVSKKIHKGAVQRNKLRRQTYEAIRLAQKEAANNYRNGTYIFIMKKTTHTPTYGMLSQSVFDTFLKITK